MIAYLTMVLSGIAACAAVVLFFVVRASRTPDRTIAKELPALLREETDRQRQATDDQSRSLRKEISESIQGFQEVTLRAFRELGDSLGSRISEFGGRLDAGIKAIDVRVEGIATKLDLDIRHMGEEASKNRDSLRQAIETKLDDQSGKQTTASRELRQEVTETIGRLQDTLIKSASDQRTAQTEQFDGFTRRLSEGLTEINQRSEEVELLLTQTLVDLATASDARHQSLSTILETKLKELSDNNARAAGAMREEIATTFQHLGTVTKDSLTAMSSQQRERLDAVIASLNALSERHEKAQEALRLAVEGRLDAVRAENTAKLEEIRKTVDEQLQTTLNERITSSFKMVHDQLEQVHRGIGEMQVLAEGVGDLKRVLTNVKTRGVFGEVQLSSLIEQMFSPDQYVENALIRENSQERVEFAIKIPGRSGEGDILLPIDAKFPIEDYERILVAAERADVGSIETSAAQLETRIRAFAQDIGRKYISLPTTTDFAILFLPIEGLYAEVLRRAGLIESIQEKHHVVIAGPTTLLAMLSAFRMSIRAVAIQQRSTEVWQILGAVRTEFDKHGAVLGKLQKQLEASLNSVDALGSRTRVMKRKLQVVDSIGTEKIEDVLGLPPVEEHDEEAIGDET